MLRDFEGLSGHLHDYKVDIANAMLEMAKSLGAPVLLVCSSTSPHARTFRVFPGEGVHSRQVADVVMRLAALGYRGDYSFEVVHDDYQQMPLPLVAQRGRRSAEWLGEDVLRRSVPLPGRLRLRSTA